MKTVGRRSGLSAGLALRGARVLRCTVLAKERDCIDVCLGGGSGQQEKSPFWRYNQTIESHC